MDAHEIVLALRNTPSLGLWMENPAGGSDYWNGDRPRIRTVINGIPTSWQRVATAMRSKDAEGKVAWIEICHQRGVKGKMRPQEEPIREVVVKVTSRAEFDEYVERQYAENEALQAMDPHRDRGLFPLLGPLERPKPYGPWKPEIKQTIRPTSIPGGRVSSMSKTPGTWPYKQCSMIAEPKPRLDLKYKQYELDEFYCDPERIQRRKYTPTKPKIKYDLDEFLLPWRPGSAPGRRTLTFAQFYNLPSRPRSVPGRLPSTIRQPYDLSTRPRSAPGRLIWTLAQPYDLPSRPASAPGRRPLTFAQFYDLS